MDLYKLIQFTCGMTQEPLCLTSFLLLLRPRWAMKMAKGPEIQLRINGPGFVHLEKN